MLEPKHYLMETVAGTGVLRLYADGFVSLQPRDRILAYWLSQAAIAGDPITYDQRSRFGRRIKELCEELVLHAGSVDPVIRPKIELFAKQVFINKGIYQHWTQSKLVPSFSRQELSAAATAALKDGAKLTAVRTEAELAKFLGALDRILFDPKFEPLGVSKSPAGRDPIKASASTYYEGLTAQDLKGYREVHPLNSRLVKRGRSIEELVYRAGVTGSGGADAGLYSGELSRAVSALRNALPFASEAQRRSLEALIAYFENGDREDYRKYAIGWVNDDVAVDAIVGFIEQYGDPRGVHGEFEGAVLAVDQANSRVMSKLAAEASYFEQRMPWAEAYRRAEFKPPIARAVFPLTLTGGAGPTTALGINLPNDQGIRQNHGSKSFLLTSVQEALSAVQGKFIWEHLLEPEQRAGKEHCASSILSSVVAMHEVIGHGSGKVLPSLQGDPKAILREYGSTLEEARADLVALHASWDPKAREIGLVADERCAEAIAQTYPAVFLYRLRAVSTGETIEEDHIRAQSVIVRYAMDQGAVAERIRDGHVYLVVTDYGQWRKVVADLLSELMKIKAEGDYEKAKALIDRHGSRLVPKWRDDVVARCTAEGLPSHFAFVSPRLKALTDERGNITDATIVDSLGLVETALVDAGKRGVGE